MVFIITAKNGKKLQQVIRMLFVFLTASLLFFFGCAGTGNGIKTLDEPQESGVLFIGNINVENINQGFEFDNWDYPMQVVIVGKGKDDVLKKYTVTTDRKGYFFLPNVPVGQYAIKAVIVPLFGSQPIKLINDLDSYDSQFYRLRHPEEEVEATAKWLPLAGEARILNFDITWLGLRIADVEDISSLTIGKVLMQKSKDALTSKRFWNDGYAYTRITPLDYFKQKFPQASWWKM